MPLDGHNEAPARTHVAGAVAGFAVAVALLAAGALALVTGLGVTPSWVNGGFWALGIAAAAAIAAGPSVGRNTGISPLLNGLAIATETVSAAFFLALAGMIFAWGHDGLAFALGLGAGCLLLQLVMAPRFAASGAASLPELFAARYPGRAARILCAAVVIASMVTLLIAELTAAGLVGARLLDVGFSTAAALAACAVLACFVVRALRGPAWASGLLFLLMLAAILVPLVELSAQWYGLPIPQVAYANALWQIQGLEETLLEQNLADPAMMRPMLTPFVELTTANFLGLVLALAVGVAALPSLLTERFAGATARAARRSALWGLAFVAVFLSLAPAIAAYAKLSLVTLIGDRTPLTGLPEWIFTYGRLELLEICGRAATDAATVAHACAALPDASPVLRLQDIVLNPDMIALALPDITGLDSALLGSIAAAVLAAALVTANSQLAVVIRALMPDRQVAPDEVTPRRQRLAAYAIAAVVLIIAGLGTLARPAGIAEIASWSLTLAATGLFPALFAALWWKRANVYGAVAGMVVGLAVALLYLVGTHYFAVPFVEAFSALSNAGQTGFEYFTELKDAWLAAEPGAAKQAAWLALDVQARSIADLWGINGVAIVLLALPAGIVALVIVSLLTPAPKPAAAATAP